MDPSASKTFDDMIVDHIEFYVSDVAENARWLVDNFGFGVYATNDGPQVRSVGVGRNRIRFVLSEPLVGDHPGTAYVDRHGDGVADIALGVADASAAYTEAVRRGARPVSPPIHHGDVVTATIMGFGDVTHTFVQRIGTVDVRALPGMRTVAEPAYGADAGLGEVDHLAVCVEAGQIDDTVAFYRDVLDFELIFTEQIVVGAQAMTTKVVQSRSGAVTLTLIEPDVSRVAGHIDEFLKNHGGAGVQHIAFTADNIVNAVDSIAARGVVFLSTPATYYRLLPARVDVHRYPIEELERLNILVDKDHDGQLFQIFAKSVHPRSTFFLELIERLGARSFGSGNIAALYEAVEMARSAEQVAR
jgi:4-hydroxymandelate synthase